MDTQVKLKGGKAKAKDIGWDLPEQSKFIISHIDGGAW